MYLYIVTILVGVTLTYGNSTNGTCTNKITNETGVLVVAIVTGLLSAVAIFGGLLTITWYHSVIRNLRSCVHVIISVLDVLIGLVGICFLCVVIHIDTCDKTTLTLTLKIDNTKPLFVAYSTVFIICYKFTAYMVCVLGLFRVEGCINNTVKMSIVWGITMLLGITLMYDIRIEAFNLDSYKLLNSLLYLPASGDFFTIEHLGDKAELIELYRAVVPAIIVLLAATIVLMLKSIPVANNMSVTAGLGSESAAAPDQYLAKYKTSDLLFVLLFLVRSLGVPVLLLLTEVKPGTLFDNVISSFLINYNLVVTPLLVSSALHPLVVILAQSNLCSVTSLLDQVDGLAEGINLPDLNIPEFKKETSAKEDAGEPPLSRLSNRIESEIAALATPKSPEDPYPELKQDTLDKKFSLGNWFPWGKKVQQRDEMKVESLVRASQNKADSRRNEVVNMLEAKRRERDIIIANARKDLKSRIGAKGIPAISDDEEGKNKGKKLAKDKHKSKKDAEKAKSKKDAEKGKEKIKGGKSKSKDPDKKETDKEKAIKDKTKEKKPKEKEQPVYAAVNKEKDKTKAKG